MNSVCFVKSGLGRKESLTLSDVMCEDQHPDLYDGERAKVWRIVRHTLSQTPIEAISLEERVAMLRRSSEGITDSELAIEFGYPEQLINLHLFFERRRLQTPELKEYYDAYWS